MECGNGGQRPPLNGSDYLVDVTYNLSRIDIVLLAVTSQVKKSIKSDEIEIVNWQNAGLLKPSVIKPVFTTIEKNLILRRLGNLEDDNKENLRLILQTILG